MTDAPQPPQPPTGGRGAGGRFAAGNRFGKGNPRLRRLYELQAAVNEALSPEDVRAVIAKLRDLALAGDVAAAKLLLDRVLARDLAEVGTFRVGAIDTAQGVAAAVGELVRGVAAGEVDIGTAERMVRMLATAAESSAWGDIEQRLAELRAAAPHQLRATP